MKVITGNEQTWRQIRPSTLRESQKPKALGTGESYWDPRAMEMGGKEKWPTLYT